ncbi:disulfide bond formation protein B [Caldichromatium japonicum]|uniref:Disulfide bond formation protein B n=1 Tax=Caldichromatium japonicum TaxID=2699430 RepID=A0A6G7VD91_9GAMM|nr:disulfide bond formation protein B [Caldichromatium japonicum]QIK38019.1 disulfide bond formation protein B [Caldichromatium japonicum]
MSLNPRLLWFILADTSASIAILSLVLALLLDLEPCHLCIFQRLVYLLLALLAALTALLWRPGRRWHWPPALSFLGLAVLGAGVAAYQSWLQWQPAASLSCSGQLGPIERLIEWLGEQFPLLFLATGACEDRQWAFLGLSLANWSFAVFVALIALGLWALRITSQLLNARLPADRDCPHQP